MPVVIKLSTTCYAQTISNVTCCDAVCLMLQDYNNLSHADLSTTGHWKQAVYSDAPIFISVYRLIGTKIEISVSVIWWCHLWILWNDIEYRLSEKYRSFNIGYRNIGEFPYRCIITSSGTRSCCQALRVLRVYSTETALYGFHSSNVA
jgi:hypothetical protein